MADKVKKRPYPRVALRFEQPTRTRHSEAAALHLPSIVARYAPRDIRGRIDLDALVQDPSRQYGDVTDLPTSRLEAMERIRDSIEAFQELPFKLRQSINHDPRLLEQWIVANPQQAFEYGLLQPHPQSSPPPSPPSSGTDEGKKGDPA